MISSLICVNSVYGTPIVFVEAALPYRRVVVSRRQYLLESSMLALCSTETVIDFIIIVSKQPAQI